MTNITLQEAYEFFIKEKRAENLSEETLKIYRLHIEHFLSTMHLHKLQCKEIEKTHYYDWIIKLQNDPKKNDVTVASYCRSVRAFIYWMQGYGYAAYTKFKLPKYSSHVKECYSPKELSLLLQKSKFDSVIEYRTWVFINLVCATGLRIRSVLNLHVQDISEDESLLYVQVTKNNHGQIVYLNSDILNILMAYVTFRKLTPSDYIFCNSQSRKPLNKRTVQEDIAAFNKKHGVNKTSVHLMRHTFAKNFYMQTNDIHTLSQLLGHSSISVTEIYLRDLGIAPERATAYNPQELFAKK